METKEDFKKVIEVLKDLKENGTLNDYGQGRLAMAKDLENLILFGVTGSLPASTEPISLITKQIKENADRVIEAVKELKTIKLPKAPL